MSTDSLSILRQQRADMVELNPSSERFSIDSGFSFYGVFDRGHMEDNKDGGNATQKKLVPLIMVSSVPDGLDPQVSKIYRDNAPEEKVYTFNFAGKDKEGLPVLWLY